MIHGRQTGGGGGGGGGYGGGGAGGSGVISDGGGGGGGSTGGVCVPGSNSGTYSEPYKQKGGPGRVHITYTAIAPTPPNVSTSPSGSSANVTGGGQTIVVSMATTGSGTSGPSTFNLAATGTETAINTFQIPGTGNLSVSHTGSAQVSVTTAGGRHLLAVDSGTVTVAATQADQPLTATGNGGILVAATQSGASVTVSANPNGAPTLKVSGGTTLNLSGAPEQTAGTVIQLAGGNASTAPVVIQSGSNAEGALSIVPGSDGGAFGVQSVTQADGSSVTALAVSSGTLTLTVPGSGNTSLMLGNAPLTTGERNTQLTVSVTGDRQILFVRSGYITLSSSLSGLTRHML